MSNRREPHHLEPHDPELPDPEGHLRRVRQICVGLSGTSEKLSQGESTFFVGKKVYAMFANNHHHDGHIAVWIAAPPGVQSHLIDTLPATYFKPPYVGVRGWIGIELAAISNEDLAAHLVTAWKLIAPSKLRSGQVPRSEQ
jgi:hypothetical protein